MKRIKKIALACLMVLLLAGCGTKEEEKPNLKKVEDDLVINTVSAHVIAMENLPKTIELYKGNSFTVSDYSSNDIILYGLNTSFGLENNIDLTAEEIKDLEARNIKDVTSYMNVSDVEGAIADTFDSVSIKHVANIGTCPSYIYDGNQNKYYVNETCVNNVDRIISYVDTVEYDENTYYVNVYAGLQSGNKVYGDMDKKALIKEMAAEETYVIDDDNKSNFIKYTYIFTKNASNKYIFSRAQRG